MEMTVNGDCNALNLSKSDGSVVCSTPNGNGGRRMKIEAPQMEDSWMDAALVQQQQQQQQQQWQQAGGDAVAQAQLLHASLLQQSLAAAGMWSALPGALSGALPTAMAGAVAAEANRAAHLQAQAALAEQAQLLLSEAGPAAAVGVEALRRGGRCGWPRCEAVVDSAEALLSHLSREHPLDARLLASARLQLEMTRQLEAQAAVESARLSGIVAHLQALLQGITAASNGQQASDSSRTPVTPQNTPSMHYATPEAAMMGVMIGMGAPSSVGLTSSPGPVRRARGSGTPSSNLDKSSLTLGGDLNKNREFYRNSSDVRPPFTYASLIRQAILESANRQLTLNEIYQWFQTEFAYFRRNEATWKNAVRHNLSLHKCFMRVENVKGAVWTVDEAEFHRRRPQRVTGLRGPLNIKEEFVGANSSEFEDSALAGGAPVFPQLSPPAGVTGEEQASTSGCSAAQSPDAAAAATEPPAEDIAESPVPSPSRLPLQMDIMDTSNTCDNIPIPNTEH